MEVVSCRYVHRKRTVEVVAGERSSLRYVPFPSRGAIVPPESATSRSFPPRRTPSDPNKSDFLSIRSRREGPTRIIEQSVVPPPTSTTKRVLSRSRILFVVESRCDGLEEELHSSETRGTRGFAENPLRLIVAIGSGGASKVDRSPNDGQPSVRETPEGNSSHVRQHARDHIHEHRQLSPRYISTELALGRRHEVAFRSFEVLPNSLVSEVRPGRLRETFAERLSSSRFHISLESLSPQDQRLLRAQLAVRFGD